MNIHFWGVRGSIPTPLIPAQIQAKISAVVQRITPKDIESDEARNRFISNLPKWIYGTVGGNTACVELNSDDGTKIIFDAGSGLRVMGKLCPPQENLHYNFIFSHFHWDHIQGLPFFDPLYNKNATFDIYSPFADTEKYLREQMTNPYFPVSFDSFSKNINFHIVKPDEYFEVGNLKVICTKMSHPGDSYSYRVEEKKPNGSIKSFVYATDVELSNKDFEFDSIKSPVFRDADVLILDSQYTVEEAMHKENWGHSAYCYAIDFAKIWGIKSVYLFHHEPTYDDRKLDSICESAKWYVDYSPNAKVNVQLAIEGQEIKL